jgi:hypothetical protein
MDRQSFHRVKAVLGPGGQLQVPSRDTQEKAGLRSRDTNILQQTDSGTMKWWERVCTCVRAWVTETQLTSTCSPNVHLILFRHWIEN